MIFALILNVIWIFLPAALANSTPVIVAKIPILKKYNHPIDFHKEFRGRRIFGDHKTIRGLLSGVVAAIIVVLIQKYLYLNTDFVRGITSLDYSQINALVFGALMGFGALFGDAIKSFFKRQLNRPSGSPWFPFDQIDFLIGSALLTYPIIKLSLLEYVILLVVGVLVHLLTNLTAYLLGIKDVPY